MQHGPEKRRHGTFVPGLLFYVLALSAAAVSSGTAAERETLRLLTECPPHAAACDLRGLVLTGAALRSVKRTRTEAGATVRTLLIEGSLNGGPIGSYAIEFTQPPDDDFATADHTAAVAQLDMVVGSPHVFTDKGLLLIETSGFEMERAPNVLVVDRERKRVLARYYTPCVDLSFLNDRSLRAMWDEGIGRCVAVRRTNGNRATPAASCTRPSTAKCDGVPVNFTSAATSVAEIKRIARDLRSLDLQQNNARGTFFGGDGWALFSYTVPRSRLFVLYGYCADCDVDPFADSTPAE